MSTIDAIEGSRLIRQKARVLGFQKVGICPAGSPPKLALLSDWLDRGNHGTMQWMQRTREKRMEIRRVLPGVRSVIVLGMNYHTEPPVNSAPFRISRYAHGRDYHRLMEQRLQSLAAELAGILPESKFLTYCDTGPIAEKVWAESAGLGWQGKHSNLLTRDYSGWLFLAVLLTDVLLEYDRPAADQCGSCVRCIEACPTQAITEPYVVDSRRCIAYLTIEHRGVIAEDLRSGIGSWIYGCDICQEVCPWDRFSQPSVEADFQAAGDWSSWDLEQWVELSSVDFNRWFSDSPMRRAKWPGFLRNLVIAIGNAGNPHHGPLLASALNHSEALVRGHAAWSLGRSPWSEAHSMLRQRLLLETDPWVLEEISSALKHG
jgi:epoxyqueuosine reductase